MNESSKMSKKQYVWLVRYGKTEYPLVEFDGPYNSDIDPQEGVHHAQCIADKIAKATMSTSSAKIYTSPFLRCVHTASIIATKMQTKINMEDGLYEWLVPSLLIDRNDDVRTYPNTMDELLLMSSSSSSPSTTKSQFQTTINKEYKNLNPYLVDESNDQFSFPEDENQLLSRCKHTLNLILNDCENSTSTSTSNDNDDTDDICENVIIVAHAPCVQSIAFAMEDGVEDLKDSKLSKWPLGGVTRFSRDVYGNSNGNGNGNGDSVQYGKWTMDFYGVTDHMPGIYKDGAGLWSLSCFE